MTHSRTDKGIDDHPERAIGALSRKGVRVWMENGALRYRAPKGALTAEDIAELQHLFGTDTSILKAQSNASPFQPRLVSEARPARAPLSFNQLAHWQLRRTAGYRPIRQVASVTRFRGALDSIALKEAVAVVVERHDSLRTNILSRDGNITQEVSERSDTGLQIVDVTSIPHSERAGEMQKQIVSAIVDVHDYSADPLSRFVLLTLDENESILILAIDHMVSDGTSNVVLEAEIFSVYDRLLKGHQLSLPTLQMQYAEYAIWQRAVLGDYVRSQKELLSSWRRTRFPEETDNLGRQGWGQIRFALEPVVRLNLAEFARRRGTTLVMVVLAAYVTLVMRWCNVSDTVVQAMSDGRTSRKIEYTVGYFAYYLYLHVSVGSDATFLDVLDAVTSEYCQACERPDFQYWYGLSPRPDFTRNTCFNWLPKGKAIAHADCPGLDNASSRSQVLFDHPLLDDLNEDAEPSVAFQDTGTEVFGLLVFPQSRFAVPTMKQFSSALRLIIDNIIARPEVPIKHILTTQRAGAIAG